MSLDRIRLLIAAWLRPDEYFHCSSCGIGPWHNSWAAIHYRRRIVMPKKPLGGCCSGAD